MTASKRRRITLPIHQAENPVNDHLGLERLVFFSDAVFAIAITLLALDIRLPAGATQLTNSELLQRLLALGPQYFSFVVSFLMIGSFWAAHNRQFRFIRRYDPMFVFLNQLLLLVIVFLPFPTRVLSEQGNRTATIFYAFTLALPGLLATLMWGYAQHGNRLVAANLAPTDRRHEFTRNLVTPLIFLLSIGVALINSDLAKYTWLLIGLGHWYAGKTEKRKGEFQMRRYLPVFVLFVLSPLIAEVLFGATPLSRLGSLLVTAPLYGGGAVLIRELARRAQGTLGGGWARIALLGAAYAIVEEGLALQSMFNPTMFNAGLLGGRVWGVNWLWSEWTIGYHIVWSICLPILLAEVLFPARRAEPWLGRVGVSVAGVIYLFGAVGLGVITWRFVTPNFRTPITLLAGAVVVLVALVALALTWPTAPSRPVSPAATRHAPSPWVVGVVALLMAAAWFWLLYLPHGLRQGFFVLLPMVLDLLLVVGVIALLRYWSTSSSWRDVHRLALVFGVLPISMAWGFFLVTAGNPVDQLGQGSASVVALVLLAFLIWRVQRREPVAEAGQAQPNRRAAMQQYPLPNRDRTEQQAEAKR